MPTARLNGIDLYYEEHGTGPAVVLMHGYSATSQMWRPQVAPLAARYRLITFDMRGHGATASPERQDDYSAELTVADLAALLRHLEVERAVIGGLSLGGYMALRFYLAHPAVTRALILCDTGPGYRNATAREEWNQRAFARAARFEAEGLAALGRSAEVEASRGSHRSAVGLARAARGMLAQFDGTVMESLDRVAVPTLVVVGSEDTPFLGACDYMTKKIPGARQVVIDGAGHGANLDRPAPFTAAVLGFLDEIGLPHK